MVARLLAHIRGQFCGDMDDKKWFSMQDWFRVHVVMWPARQMKKKDFTLPARRYEEILREIFMGIKKHGNTAVVRDWPGYLLKCVQDHWAHNWEDYYREAKSTRNLAESALLACGKVPKAEDRTVETLAQAQALIARKTRPKRQRQPKQQELF
jgi:hypothetical protein